jgi:Tfp pilus assembly protein PilN
MRGIRALLKAAAISAILSVGFLFLLAQVQTYYYRNALAGRTIELSNLKSLAEQWERMTGIKDTTARKLEIYEQLVLREPMMYGILKEISRLTPKDIQLIEVSYTKGKPLRLKGLAFSSHGPERVLAQYMGTMESSPFFKDVDLYAAKEINGYSVRASQFELGLSLK